MQQVRWFDRRFNFDSNQNIFPSILERLSDTPLRLENKLKFIKPAILKERVENTWSIQENVGHLIDLEPLWQERFEQIKSGKHEMTAADLQNTKTESANHNARSINDLLSEFRNIRSQTIQMIENIDESVVFKSALHPRLKTPMRTMDLFLFVAEHDDHHLARITAMARLLS